MKLYQRWDKKTNYQKSIHTIIKDNLSKHNSNKDKFGIMYINDFIESKNCHAVAIFKDYMIADNKQFQFQYQ